MTLGPSSDTWRSHLCFYHLSLLGLRGLASSPQPCIRGAADRLTWYHTHGCLDVQVLLHLDAVPPSCTCRPGNLDAWVCPLPNQASELLLSHWVPQPSTCPLPTSRGSSPPHRPVVNQIPPSGQPGDRVVTVGESITSSKIQRKESLRVHLQAIWGR